MRALLATFAITGISACHSPLRPDDFVPFGDASTIDASCASSDVFEPISATGFSPTGPLDVYRYTDTNWWCGSYFVRLSRTMDLGCNPQPAVVLAFEFPRDAMQPGSGTFPATVRDEASESTTEASFEATHIDPPTAASPQLVGRFVTNTSGWSVDLSVDLHARDLGLGGCTL